MTKNLETLAEEIFKEAELEGEPVTKEEALEMAKMELGAKNIKNYTQSQVEKKPKAPRERKVDEENKRILADVKTLLEGIGAENTVMKTETEVSFLFGENNYTIKLTKHRPPKK